MRYLLTVLGYVLSVMCYSYALAVFFHCLKDPGNQGKVPHLLISLNHLTIRPFQLYLPELPAIPINIR
jgi:hypothetical protein